MTAKFGGVTRFRQRVVNLPHTRRQASDENKGQNSCGGAKDCVSERSNPSQFVIAGALAASGRKLIKH